MEIDTHLRGLNKKVRICEKHSITSPEVSVYKTSTNELENGDEETKNSNENNEKLYADGIWKKPKDVFKMPTSKQLRRNNSDVRISDGAMERRSSKDMSAASRRLSVDNIRVLYQPERSQTVPNLFEKIVSTKCDNSGIPVNQYLLRKRSLTMPYQNVNSIVGADSAQVLQEKSNPVRQPRRSVWDLFEPQNLQKDVLNNNKKDSGLWNLASASMFALKSQKFKHMSDVTMAIMSKQLAIDKMREKVGKKLNLPEGRFARLNVLRQNVENIEKKFKSMINKTSSKKVTSEMEEDYSSENELQPRFTQPGEAITFFRKCARLILIVLKWIELIMDNEQNRLERELMSFVDIANEVEESSVSQSMIDSGLSFDKNFFKAKREISLTMEHRKILTTRWNFRTQEMIQQVMHGLQALRSLSEYPLHTQEKLCRVAWYQKIKGKKAIVRQGHKAESFYFILSGTAYVKKLLQDPKTGETRVNTVARLGKGSSFGELGLIFNTLRNATVESATAMELLVIGKEDFNRIFIKADNPDEEADHVKFLRSVSIMQHWPVDRLKAEPGTCLLHYFKRGTLVTENGRTSDWLYFVKSGSCEVLKKLKTARPSKAGQAQRKLDPMCDVILPELSNPASPRVNTGQVRPKTRFVMDPEVFDDMSRYFDKLKKMFPSEDTIRSEKPPKKFTEEELEELHGARPSIFVMIESLFPKDSFGFNTLTGWGSDDIDDLLNESPPVSLVSNGAEVIMLSKKIFMKYINDDVRRTLRESVRPYPQEKVMQDNLQRKVDWDQYKTSLIEDWLERRTVWRKINMTI